MTTALGWTCNPSSVKPTVGIVITNYNHAEYLRGAVDSALAQTRPADEILVVDDASTDTSSEVLNALPGTVRVLRREENGGVVAARNTGLSAIATDFVVYLDADDELLPRFLEVTLRAYSLPLRKSVGFVYAPARMVNLARGGRGYMHARGFERQRLAEFNFVSNTSLILRRALLDVGGYATEMEDVGHEDWDVFLSMVEKGWRGRLVARPLFLYRTLQGSRNELSMARMEDVRRVLEQRHPWIAEEQPSVALRKARRAVVAARQAGWRWIDERAWSYG